MKVFQFIKIVTVCLLAEGLFASSASASLPIAINKERDQLLQNALSWMTLRSDGILPTSSQLAPFLNALREKYRASKFYRSFVIAFQKGVVPRLTLNEGERCDPTYTKLYKDHFNNSVTWYMQKNFTMENYYSTTSRGSVLTLPAAYCDYRKGLVCLPAKNQCGCPEGSIMEGIGPQSKERRCLLEEDEVCSLVDLGQGKTHMRLEENLYHLIFNLEKPLGCKEYTQCRYKGPGNVPRCYSFIPGDIPGGTLNGWTEPEEELSYGDECVLDLYGDRGMCGNAGEREYETHLVCFNFWGILPTRPLPSTGLTSKRVGYCSSEFAPFITDDIQGLLENNDGTFQELEPFVRAYVNPRTVPMRNPDLKTYDLQLSEIGSNYLNSRISESDGEPCSVAGTKELRDLWKFYSDLEATPPTGKDYGSDDAALQTKLNELSRLVGSPIQMISNPKFCRVMWQLKKGDNGMKYKYPFECVSTGKPPDSKKNDGKCQRSNNNDSLPFAQSLSNFFEHLNTGKMSIAKEDTDVDLSIIKDNVESQCKPPNTKASGRSLLLHADVLEGGACPAGYVCYEDLSDLAGIYVDQESCLMDPSTYNPQYVCHNASSTAPMGKCEKVTIQRNIDEIFEKIPRLSKGDACQHPRDGEIRNLVLDDDDSGRMNYQFVNSLEEYLTKGHGLCDATRLLECNADKTCHCIDGTTRRGKAIQGQHYYGDFCYLTTGSCDNDVSQLILMTDREKMAVQEHYGDPKMIKADCTNGNICIFIDAPNGECTTDPTGKTGVDVEEAAPTTKRPKRTTTRKGQVKPTKEANRESGLPPPTPYSAGSTISLVYKGKGRACLIGIELIVITAVVLNVVGL